MPDKPLNKVQSAYFQAWARTKCIFWFSCCGEMAAITIRGCRAVNPPQLQLATQIQKYEIQKYKQNEDLNDKKYTHQTYKKSKIQLGVAEQ